MSPGMVSPGPHPGDRPGVEACKRAAQTSDMGLSSSSHSIHRRVQKGPVLCDLGGGCGQGPRRPNHTRVKRGTKEGILRGSPQSL